LIGIDDADIADAGERKGAPRDAGVKDLIVIGNTGKGVGRQRDQQNARRSRCQHEPVARKAEHPMTPSTPADRSAVHL
jgi:hypothetical protein